MAGNFETSAAYQAALDLVLKGLVQPSGYTEPLLHAWEGEGERQRDIAIKLIAVFAGTT